MPIEYLPWIFIEKYGWTMAEVDALSMQDLQDWFQIQDGKGKAK